MHRNLKIRTRFYFQASSLRTSFHNIGLCMPAANEEKQSVVLTSCDACDSQHGQHSRISLTAQQWHSHIGDNQQLYNWT